MSYPNAVLTLRHRLNVTQLVVEEDLLIGDVTARFQVVCLSPLAPPPQGSAPPGSWRGRPFRALCDFWVPSRLSWI